MHNSSQYWDSKTWALNRLSVGNLITFSNAQEILQKMLKEWKSPNMEGRLKILHSGRDIGIKIKSFSELLLLADDIWKVKMAKNFNIAKSPGSVPHWQSIGSRLLLGEGKLSSFQGKFFMLYGWPTVIHIWAALTGLEWFMKKRHEFGREMCWEGRGIDEGIKILKRK